MLRILLVILALKLSACAVMPMGAGQSGLAPEFSIESDLDAAFEDYTRGEYGMALLAFQAVISESPEQPELQRRARIGSALVYLSDDAALHDPEAAENSLARAVQLTGDSGAPASMVLANDVLLDAASALLAAQSEIGDLTLSLDAAQADASQVRRERDSLRNQQQELAQALQQLTEMSLHD